MVLSPDFVLAARPESLHVLFVVSVGASLALFLTFSEYLLLSNTSSITVSICGIMKVRAICSADYFHEVVISLYNLSDRSHLLFRFDFIDGILI